MSFSGGKDLLNINLEDQDAKTMHIEVPEYDHIEYMAKYDLFIGTKNN